MSRRITAWDLMAELSPEEMDDHMNTSIEDAKDSFINQTDEQRNR